MMKQRRILVAILLALASVPSLAIAEPYIYEHDGEPLFSITFPEGWYVDSDFMPEAKAGGPDTGFGFSRPCRAMAPSSGSVSGSHPRK